MVDDIVDTLAQDDRVAAAYAEWHRLRCEILKTYRSELPEIPPLSQQKEFRSIKNTAIAEALKLGGRGVFTAEDEIKSSYAASSATTLLRALSKLFEQQTDELLNYRARHESKSMSKECRKKVALGHAEDDREQFYV